MKRVFITGGTGGIGSACVEEFSKNGWQVTFTYLKSEEKAKELCRRFDNCSCIKMDLGDSASVDSLDNEASYDAVVNNAAVSLFSMLQDTPTEKMKKLFEVDLFGSYGVLHKLIPRLISQGKKAAVVNVASMWGQSGASCESAYSAAKGAMIALTRALALELAPCNIRFNCVSPGVIDTAMNRHLTSEERKEIEESIPLGCFGTSEQIAKICRFLCDDRSSYITAQLICPNGGQLIGI